MNRLYRVLSESYLVVMIAALVLGLFVPAARHLIPWNTFFLQIIFFLSCLKINPKQIGGFLKNWKFLLLANFLMLIGFPLLVWAVMNPLAPSLGLALFLLAAMPVGMTTPLLVEVVGGKQAVAMVLTVTTSLLAPITIPILTKWLYGATISVDASAMFFQLASVIFLPFVLALLARRILTSVVERVKSKTKPLSIFLLGLLIAGAVAKQSDQIIALSRDGWNLVLILVVLCVFFLIMHLIGYFAFWWETHENRNTASVSLTYMNFTLAIFLATKFFPEPEIVLPLVLSILPWATLLSFWKWASNRFLNPATAKNVHLHQ